MLKLPDYPLALRRSMGLGLLFFILILTACSPTALPEKQPALSTLQVVMDENYPPYVFRDEQGEIKGITIDQWKLWEERTGVKVEITAVPWGEALERMKAGEFDVIDTAFYKPDRAQYLDYTDPYAQINIRIFFQKNISGIANVEDLKGFKVAVKTGDASADDLRKQGGIDLTYYDNYEEIIQAAKRKEVTIFVIDEPPALYFLYKYGIYDQFNYSASLGDNKFYRAVHKGEASTLALVKDGFSRISKAEYQEIDQRWLGSSLTNGLQQYLPYLASAAALAALAILVLFIFNRMLQSRVQARTLDLQNALNDLQKSETRFREAIEFLPVPTGIADAQGNTLSFNRKFVEYYGYSVEDVSSLAEWMRLAYSEPEYREKVQTQWDADIANAVRTKASTELREYRVTCKDGSQRDVEVVTHPIGDLWVTTFNDVTERKLTEEALRENEVIFSSFLEHSPIYVFFKGKDIRSLRLSKNYEQMLGMPIEAALGKTMDELFPSELAKNMVADDLRILNEGQLVEVVEEFNGRIYETTKFPILKDGRPFMLAGFTVDITDRRQAEAALRESEENYRNLVELSPDTILVHSEGKVVFINSAGVRLIHARDAEEVLGLPAINFVHPDQRAMVSERIREIQAAGEKSVPLEEKFVCMDGVIIDVEVVAMPIYYEGQPAIQMVVRDNTERRRSIAVLQQSEKRFRTLIENSADALTLLNADGSVFYEGPTVSRLTGYSPSERLGRSGFDNVYPDDLPLAKNALEGLLAAPDNSTTIQFRSIRKDGTIWWTEATATNLLHDPSVQAVVVNYRDITERKQSEEKLRESEERSRQIIEASPMGMHMYQLQGDQLIFVGANPAGDRILGVDNSQFVGKAIEEAFPPLAETEVPDRYRQAASEGVPWNMVQIDYDHAGIRGAYEVHAFQTGPRRMAVMFLDITDRKKAQADLEKSEKRNRAIVAALPDLLFEISAEGRFLDCIASDLSRFLVPPEQAIGRQVDELFPPELATLTLEKVRQTLSSGEMQVYDYSIQLNQKTEYYESRMTPLGPDSALALVRDITESKQIEQELRQSEQRYRTLFEQANDAIFVETQADQIIDVNQHACQMLGYSREELLTMRVSDLVAVESRHNRQVIRQELSDHGRKPFESLDVRKDGVRISVEVTNSILPNGLALSIVRDITERKHAEDELRNSENRFRILFEQSGVGVAQVDSFTGRFIQINQKYCEILGYTREELEQMDFQTITYPDDLQKDRDDMARLRAGEISEFTMEKRYYRKNGSLVWVILIVSPLWAPGEKPDTHIAVIHDITEKKRTEFSLQYSEAEVRKLNAELERRVVERTVQLEVANKELEAFSYSVSHDLRAPLRAIEGFSRVILEEYASRLDGEGKELLQHVRAEGNRMGQLIDALLNLSRMSRTEIRRETVDLSSLAHQVVDGLRQSQPQRLVESVIAEGVVAQGDARLLLIVLENLLGNAWKFTSRRELAHIEFGIDQRESELVYFVRDDGAGFDLAYADKLFSAFQRLHRSDEFEGTGIGLATVRRIILRHGGRVWAEAELGKGATFYFTLG